MLVLSLHAQWGIAQFILQRDIGLYLFGESRLSTSVNGVAKFSVGDEKMIRAYGPYRHANTFGGMMVLGIVLLIFFAQRRDRSLYHVFFLMLFFLMLLGLLVSFSRTAYLAATVPVLLAVQRWRSGALKLALLLLTVVVLFSPLLISRSRDPADVSASERRQGWKWSWSIIMQGSSREAHYEPYRVALERYLTEAEIAHHPWQIDYVHSVPLLLAAEVGLGPAIILLLGIVVMIVYYWREGSVWFAWLLPLLLLDHYMLTQADAAYLATLGCLAMLDSARDVTL
ncbi:MAG TPA: hypothetical protein VJC05_01695 [Candidatus Andersenbacteria bacterium]|nr:hypothetical protein [Candidatus Andersenbacteria bacterium]